MGVLEMGDVSSSAYSVGDTPGKTSLHQALIGSLVRGG